MSKATSAAAVFSVLEFSKRFTSNTKDPIRECCEFLAKLKINPVDAGVIRDSSGGMIWFTNDGMQILNSFIKSQESQSQPTPDRKVAESPTTQQTPSPNTKKVRDSSATDIQRIWRGYVQRRKLKQRIKSIRIQRHERKESYSKISDNLKDHAIMLSQEYHTMVQNPNHDRELAFIKILNSSETFQAAIGLTSYSLTHNSPASKNSTGSQLNSPVNLQSSTKFIQWVNRILNTNYQLSENLIEILKNGNLLCRIVVRLFPSTECLLLEKGLEYSIHKIIFFLEFCRCIGISGVFKVADLMPPLVKEETQSVFAVLKTIYDLQTKAKTVSNWNGPIFEFDLHKEAAENGNNNLQPIEGQKSEKKPGQDMYLQHESSRDSLTSNISLPNKGPVSRLKEKRAKRTSSMPFSLQVKDPSPFVIDHEETSSKRFSDSERQKTSQIKEDLSIEPPKKENDSFFMNMQKPTEEEDLKEEISQFSAPTKEPPKPLKLALPPRTGSMMKHSIQSQDNDGEKEILHRKLPPTPPKVPLPLKTGASERNSIYAIENGADKWAARKKENLRSVAPSAVRYSSQSADSDYDSTGIDPKESNKAPYPSQSFKIAANERDSVTSTDSFVDLNRKTFIEPIVKDNKRSSTENRIGDPVPSQANPQKELEEARSKLALKISSNERLFSTIMAHMVEYLDILAANRKNALEKLRISADELKEESFKHSYSSSLMTMVDHQIRDDESEKSYACRLYDELDDIAQYREIALSIMALHRRLSKAIKGVYEEPSTRKDGTFTSSTFGDFFMNFANDMLTPYIRFAIIFFGNRTSTSDQDFIKPSTAADVEYVIDFIKKFIKNESGKMVQAGNEEWERFLKFPVQRLHNYSIILDDIIASSNRPLTEIDNRKLKIAKLKILAAFESIKERFE